MEEANICDSYKEIINEVQILENILNYLTCLDCCAFGPVSITQ